MNSVNVSNYCKTTQSYVDMNNFCNKKYGFLTKWQIIKLLNVQDLMLDIHMLENLLSVFTYEALDISFILLKGGLSCEKLNECVWST